MRRLLDKSGNTITEFYYHSDDTFTINSVQDVQPILDHNKRLQNWNDGYTPSREMRRVATVPAVVWEQWMKEGMPQFGYERKRWIRKKLQSSEWQWLKTSSAETNRVVMPRIKK